MKKLVISGILSCRAWSNPLFVAFGIPMPTTSSVIAIANTASLKNTTRSNSSEGDCRS